MMGRKKAIFIMVALGFLLYFNSLFNNFVWDDEEQIVNNYLVHSLKNLPALFIGSTFNPGGASTMSGIYYKPLMMVFFSFLYSLFGPRPFFFHLFQISLHIVNSILVFLFFDYFFNRIINQLGNGRCIVSNQEKDGRTKGRGIAFFLSLIFLVHPQNTEAVVYISALQDVLFFFFGIMGLLIMTAIDSVASFPPASARLGDSCKNDNSKVQSEVFSQKDEAKKWHTGGTPSTGATYRGFFIASFFLFLSLLSKETGVVFILIVFLYFFLFERKRLFLLVPFFLMLAFLYFVFRLAIGGVGFEKHNLTPITRINIGQRMISAPKIIYFYLKTFFFPQELAISQHWFVEKISFDHFYFPLIIATIFFLFLLVVGLTSFHRRLFLFFFFWFILGLSLHIHLFPLDMTVADRWFYLPMIGLLGAIGVIAPKLKIKNQKLKIIMGITIIGALSLRTFFRTFDWRNGLTLYSNDIKISKGAFDLENNLGVELFRIGKFDEARTHFENSIKLEPYWWTNWNNLGVVYERKGDFKKAEEYYKKAIDNGDYYLAFENYAGILIKQKKFEQAKDFLEKEAIPKFPDNQKLKEWYLFLNQSQ